MSTSPIDPDEPPEASALRWREVLEESLANGRTALWYSRFAVGADGERYRKVLIYDRAWGECFAGRPVVTLCPYVVGGLDGAQTLERMSEVARMHEGVLISGDGEPTLLQSATD